MVEDLIENPNLNVYYAHTAIPALRFVNVFDRQQSLQYSDQIKAFLCELVQDLRFGLLPLNDKFSHFIGNHDPDTSSNDDLIQFDSRTINGAISLEKSKKAPITIAKHVFLIFVKLLHELAHASIFKCARLMLQTRGSISTTNKNELFNTPATHALSGEAGNAIERFLFCSVIDTVGIQEEKPDDGLYIIKQVLMREQRPRGIIDGSWLWQFVNLDLTTLNKIPMISCTPLTKKIECSKIKSKNGRSTDQ